MAYKNTTVIDHTSKQRCSGVFKMCKGAGPGEGSPRGKASVGKPKS